MQNLNADRIFLVDPNSSRTDVKTYAQFLLDLESTVTFNRSTLHPNLAQAKHQIQSDLYRYLVGLLAAIINDAPITLDGFELCSITEDIAIENESPSRAHVDVGAQTTLDVSNRIANLRDRILNSKCRLTLFTSGSTGTPKPIQQVVNNLTRVVQISPKHEHDVWGLAYQPTKIAALQVILQAICNGNTIVNLFRKPIAESREVIRDWKISHFSATPTYFRLIAADSSPFPMVRAVTVGGEVCDSALRSKLDALFPNAKFRNVYASSEVGTLLHSSNDCFVVPDAIQRSVIIRDGRLWIHHSLIAENLRDQCIDGFWDSGDEVQIVDENPLRLRVTGRRTDWINVGGTKVNPHEVEKTLRDIPGIIDARVYGIANSVTGQLVAAELTKEEAVEIDIPTIRKILQQKLLAAAVPRVIKFLDNIKSTDTLKKERQ